MGLRFTQRDQEILRALTLSVRLFSYDQARGHWWPDDETGALARRRFRQLAENGWLSRAAVMSRPLPKLEQPIRRWSPGLARPDFGADAWQAQNRWTGAAQKVSVIVAADKASLTWTGKKARGIRQGFQLTHDLGMAEVFLRFRGNRPELAARWQGEERLASRRRGKKLPDAVIVGETDWPPELVIEFAGAYGKDRLQKFHTFCEREAIAYELW